MKQENCDVCLSSFSRSKQKAAKSPVFTAFLKEVILAPKYIAKAKATPVGPRGGVVRLSFKRPIFRMGELLIQRLARRLPTWVVFVR
jgi:hypothetical protein